MVLAQADGSVADLISSAVSGNEIVIVVPGRVTSVASKKGIAAFTSILTSTGFLEEAAVTGEVILGLPRAGLRRRLPQGYSKLIREVQAPAWSVQ